MYLTRLQRCGVNEPSAIPALNNIVEFEQQPSDRNKQSHRKMQLTKRFRSKRKNDFFGTWSFFSSRFPFPFSSFFFYILPLFVTIDSARVSAYIFLRWLNHCPMQHLNSDKEQQCAIGLACTAYGRGNPHCWENLVIDTLERWSLHESDRPNTASVVQIIRE